MIECTFQIQVILSMPSDNNFKFEENVFMPIKDLKEKLRTLIEAIDNEVLLEDLLLEAENRINTNNPHEAEGLSKEDYEELISLVNEAPEKETISYEELKSSLSKWFTK